MSPIKKLTLAIACVLSLSLAYAQNIKVSGVVSATSGESVIGAGVLVKGTTTGVTTDIDGRYTIEVPANAVLEFSSIGFKTVDVKVDGRAKIDITLQSDAQLLEEAVAVGYGSQSKLTLTGSVATTTGNELVKNSAVNLSQGLAGRLSGVIVNNRSGEPGADDATMYIRGRSTLGNNSPLIIIDGVPGRGGDFSRLTGEEIESINVLKDASAAIYGARSANGVILVTTKRGKYGEAPKVTFTYDLGLQQPTRLVKMADAVTYALAYNAMQDITSTEPGTSHIYTPEQIAKFASGEDPMAYPNTDWMDAIIKPLSAQHKYGVSINGGSDKVAYFVQFNGQYQDGIYEKSATNFNLYNLRSNVDIQVTNSLKLGLDISARQQHKNYSAYPSDSYGIFYVAMRAFPYTAPYYPDGKIRNLKEGQNAAIYVQDITGYDKTTINTINTTFSANWDLGFITKGLSVNGKMAYDVVSNFRKNWKTPWTCYDYDQVKEEYIEKKSHATTPSLYESQGHSTTLTLNANINYDRDFDGHHVSALAGFEQSAYRYDGFNSKITAFDSDILDEFFAGSADKNTYSIGGSASETARRSFFGRLGYDFKSKYMIQALVRFDGSENFPKENRWGVFPGVSAGWRLSEEAFIKDNAPWLTNLKLRASYGEQGNDQISAFQYLTTFGYNTGTKYRLEMDGSKVNIILPSTIPNPNVTWEVAKTWNVGMDGNVNNGIFAWEFEAFKTRRTNILCTRNASVPYYTGMTLNLPDENIGIVSNKGFELQLSHQNRVNEFMYHVAGNFMFAKNKIEFMDETPWGEGHEYLNQTGHPMGSGLYYQVAGINRTEEDLTKYPQVKGATLGDFYYKDIDGNGVIDSYDRLRSDETTVPQIVFGLNFDAQWRGFDITVLLQGQAKARFYYSPLTDPVSYNLEYYAAKNAWTKDNVNATFPRLGSSVSKQTNNFFHRDASFIRLKNVELGYTVPQKAFDKIPVKGLRFYVAGYNLLTFSDLKEVDPETSSGELQNYPQMRIFNAGVKLTF